MRARAQTAHRPRWHEEHRRQIKQPAPKMDVTRPPRTLFLRSVRRAEVFLLLARQRGLLRHLSWIFWDICLRIFRLLWKIFLWTRGAYQFARWRLSKSEDVGKILEKIGLCRKCPWFVESEDGGWYCSACICPRKPRADLRLKNRRRYPHCPTGVHPGSKVDPYARLKPCVGCGDQKHGDTTLGREGDRGSGDNHRHRRRHTVR
jgi:hypothetical protein